MIKRYDVGAYGDIREDAEGEYVRLDDFNAVVSRLDAASAELDNQARYAAGALEEMTRQRDDAVSRLDAAETLCSQMYQVLGSLTDDFDILDHPLLQKAMTALSERKAPDDLLPWPAKRPWEWIEEVDALRKTREFNESLAAGPDKLRDVAPAFVRIDRLITDEGHQTETNVYESDDGEDWRLVSTSCHSTRPKIVDSDSWGHDVERHKHKWINVTAMDTPNGARYYQCADCYEKRVDPCKNPVEDNSGFQLCANCGTPMADHQ